MSDVIALGCGLVGKFVIRKLLENGNSVTVVDLKIPTEIANLENVEPMEGDVFTIIDTLPHSKVVVNMLPGRIGDRVRPKLLESKHQIIDLAFTLEDPSKYSQLAKENDCSLLWDVGIAPGLSNMLV
ncbi:MAG: hypothetical protein HON16_04760, partial [Euryarchaeota archaeon]|nr:hypothetical protein [Euryarchaeota archaeon]